MTKLRVERSKRDVKERSKQDFVVVDDTESRMMTDERETDKPSVVLGGRRCLTTSGWHTRAVVVSVPCQAGRPRRALSCGPPLYSARTERPVVTPSSTTCFRTSQFAVQISSSSSLSAASTELQSPSRYRAAIPGTTHSCR